MRYGFGGRFSQSVDEPWRSHASKVDDSHIRIVRNMLAQGFTLKEAARAVNLMATDLDKYLWHWIGEEVEKPQPKYHPMFLE